MQMIRSHSATPPSRSLGPSGGRWPGGATRCILFPPSKPWSGSRIGNGSRASGDVRERGLHGQECAAPAGPARPQPATSSGSAGQGPGLSRPGPSRESRRGAQRRRELPRGRVRPRMGILFTRIWRLFNHQGEGLGWGAGSSPGPGGGRGPVEASRGSAVAVPAPRSVYVSRSPPEAGAGAPWNPARLRPHQYTARGGSGAGRAGGAGQTRGQVPCRSAEECRAQERAAGALVSPL